MSGQVRRIVIVGGGSACWLAALTFARALAGRGAITVVETPEDTGELEAEASLPALRGLHRILQLDERDLMRHARATFKLGTELVDWSGPASRYFHPYGDLGAALDSVAFHHHWFRVRETDESLADYSLAAAAAQLARFSLPASDPRSPLSTLDYGMHLDVREYANYLLKHALRAGVAHVRGRLVDVELSSGDDLITALTLDNGTRVEGDLFVDCTGPSARLIGQSLHAAYEDWTQWLPCDRVITVSTSAPPDQAPCTRATAHSAGWQWRMPLQGRTHHGFVYSSAFLSEADAMATFSASFQARALGEPRLSQVRAGRRKHIWKGNCIALGAAAGWLDPLESSFLHLVHSTLSRVIDLFPHGHFPLCVSDELNRLISNQQEQLRDWLILHYKGNARCDSPFWKACSEMSIPETLARKIELFASRGRVVLYDEESLPESSWVSVFAAQQRWPHQIDPRAETLDAQRARDQLNRMKAAIRQTAQGLPTHREFLQRYCPAPATEAGVNG